MYRHLFASDIVSKKLNRVCIKPFIHYFYAKCQLDAVPAPDVPLKRLQYKLQAATGPEQKRQIAQKINELMEVSLVKCRLSFEIVQFLADLLLFNTSFPGKRSLCYKTLESPDSFSHAEVAVRSVSVAVLVHGS